VRGPNRNRLRDRFAVLAPWAFSSPLREKNNPRRDMLGARAEAPSRLGWPKNPLPRMYRQLDVTALTGE